MVQRITDDDLMKDHIKQQIITKLNERITSRLKDEKGFELPDMDENQLFLEDGLIQGEDEVAFAEGIEPMIDKDDIEYSPDAYDPYIGTDIIISHGDQADRA
eukprot:scaffold12886_cov57-Attheya_sp.AAC.2